MADARYSQAAGALADELSASLAAGGRGAGHAGGALHASRAQFLAGPRRAGFDEPGTRAATGMIPAGPLPSAEGIGRREWVASNISSTQALLDPMLSRAGKRLAPQKAPAQIGISLLLSSPI